MSELHVAVGKRGEAAWPSQKKKMYPPSPVFTLPNGLSLEGFCRFWEFVDWKGIVLPSRLATEAEGGNPPRQHWGRSPVSMGTPKVARNRPRQIASPIAAEESRFQYNLPSHPRHAPLLLLPIRDAASTAPALQIQLVMAGLIDCRFPCN